MKKLIILLLLLPSALRAQVLTDSIVADSVVTDTLLADTVLVDSTAHVTVQERIRRLLEADMFRTSQVGLRVWDLTADTLVYAFGDTQTLRPASTMKLLTAITALDRLGSSYRYATTLTARGAVVRREETARAVYVGDITVRGGMDPRFSADDMRAFVEALQRENIDTIFGLVREDRSFKDGDLLGEGWCWDDKNPVLTPLPWQRKDGFMAKFRAALAAADICVLPADSASAIDRPAPRDTMLCSRHHTLGQVLMRMMKESDNLYAESLFYQIAASRRTPARASYATDLMKALIRRIGLDPARYRIADGSGLSLYNYQSAELQTALLRYAYRNSDIYLHLLPTLPVGGEDGTLKKRMLKAPCRGNVKAKTGTLTGISSLAGYLTSASGNTLCFSIINQGVMHAANAKRFQDRVCEVLCRYK